MKFEIPVKYFMGGSLAAVVIISVFLLNFHEPSVSNSVPQNTDNKILQVYNSIPTQTGKNIFLIQSENLTKPVDPDLVGLDSQIISCGSNVDGLLSSSPNIAGSCTGPSVNLENVKGKYLGGQCCGALMNTTKYHKQLEQIKQYSNIPDVPLDPYKTPVDVAKKWVDYDHKTTLNTSEQAVYNQAMKTSEEGGPCCCKCWHYYVNEGIAKKMIHDYNYNAQQVADFWDTSDICGI